MGSILGISWIDRAVNPLREMLGVAPSPLPPGVKPVDYGALLGGYDNAMMGFAGADPAGKRMPIAAPKKDQSRLVPQRGSLDQAPSRLGSRRLERQQAGDMPPEPRPFGTDTAMKLMQHRRGTEEAMAAQDALVEALLNGDPMPFSMAAFESQRAPVDSGDDAEQEAAAVEAVPRPRLRPSTEYVVRDGDNPTTIARKLGRSLAELNALNPGLVKNARRLRVGTRIKL